MKSSKVFWEQSITTLALNHSLNSHQFIPLQIIIIITMDFYCLTPVFTLDRKEENAGLSSECLFPIMDFYYFSNDFTD